MIEDVHINNPKSVAEGDGIPSRFTHGLRERRHFREAVAHWRSPSCVVGDSVLYHSLLGVCRLNDVWCARARIGDRTGLAKPPSATWDCGRISRKHGRVFGRSITSELILSRIVRRVVDTRLKFPSGQRLHVRILVVPVVLDPVLVSA